jgi:hypothetical protein
MGAAENPEIKRLDAWKILSKLVLQGNVMDKVSGAGPRGSRKSISCWHGKEKPAIGAPSSPRIEPGLGICY